MSTNQRWKRLLKGALSMISGRADAMSAKEFVVLQRMDETYFVHSCSCGSDAVQISGLKTSPGVPTQCKSIHCASCGKPQQLWMRRKGEADKRVST